MQRSFWGCIFSVILIPATSLVAVSLPQPPVPQYPEVRVDSEQDSPYCYMQLAEGQLLNLEELCRASAGRVEPLTYPEAKPSTRSRSTDKPSSPRLFPSGRYRNNDDR